MKARFSSELVLALQGAIDESAAKELAKLNKPLAAAPAGALSIDCRDVKGINSPGVKALSQWLEAVAALRAISWHHCPASLVEYFSLLPERLMARCVHSLEVPYRCRDCSHEERPVMQTAAIKTNGTHSLLCPTCQGAMLPAVVVEDYLSFLD